MNSSGFGIGCVRLEEHVLVQVRQPLVLRALRERAVLHVRLDRHERHAVILDDDHLEPVRQRRALNAPLQLGALRVCDASDAQAEHRQRARRAKRATNARRRARWRHREPSMVSFTLTMSNVDPQVTRTTRRAGSTRRIVRRNEPLAPYTTFKIGGPADLFFEATSADALANAVLAARETGVPYFVLGLGANVLIGDRGFRGLVIRNTARAHEFRDDRRRLPSLDRERRDRQGPDPGIRRARLVGTRALRRHSEHRWRRDLAESALPVAGAGARTHDVHRRGVRVVRDPDGGERAEDRRRRLRRASATTTRSFIIGATSCCRRPSSSRAAIRRAAAHPAGEPELARRKHPWLEWHPSAGSIFKKIEGVGAGRLVDQCGLKGFRIGDAQISHIHANIMVNLGDATAKDVRELIALAQQTVEKNCGVHLEPEIGFIGEF